MPVSLEKEEITAEQMGALAHAMSRTAQVFLDMAQTVKEFHVPPVRSFGLVEGPVISAEMTGDPFFSSPDAMHWRPEQ